MGSFQIVALYIATNLTLYLLLTSYMDKFIAGLEPGDNDIKISFHKKLIITPTLMIIGIMAAIITLLITLYAMFLVDITRIEKFAETLSRNSYILVKLIGLVLTIPIMIIVICASITVGVNSLKFIVPVIDKGGNRRRVI